MLRLKIFLVICICVYTFADHNCQDAESIVDTQGGCVAGLVTDSVRKFLGIPFAEPPVSKKKKQD
jgi:hypothetical protein